MRIVALLLVSLFSSTALAQNDKVGFFLQADGGAAYFSDVKLDGEKANFEDGWSAGLRAGVDLEYGGFEFEYGLHGAEGSTRNGVGVDRLLLTTGMGLNFKFLRTSWLDWYGGSGVSFDIPIGDDNYFDQKGNSRVYIETGFIIKPTDTIQLVPHYRLHARAYQEEVNTLDYDLEFIHTVRLGVRLTKSVSLPPSAEQLHASEAVAASIQSRARPLSKSSRSVLTTAW